MPECACVCMCVCVCLCGCESYPLCALCLQGIRGDPCGTGIYNRPAGPSQCDDKAPRVLCECLCVRICTSVCIPAGWLSIGTPVNVRGEIIIKHIWQPKQGAHSEVAGQGVLQTMLLIASEVFMWCVYVCVRLWRCWPTAGKWKRKRRMSPHPTISISLILCIQGCSGGGGVK